MKRTPIPDPPNIYLNSFQPLCLKKFGRYVVDINSLSAYIDGSCRREPDFQNPYPSTTSTYRAAGFAPRLYPQDVVVYMTTKGRFGRTYLHNRLVAILQVIDRKESHEEAASWYQERKLPIPSNCLVPGNDPMPFNMTCGISDRRQEFNFRMLNIKLEVREKLISVWNASFEEELRGIRCLSSRDNCILS